MFKILSKKLLITAPLVVIVFGAGGFFVYNSYFKKDSDSKTLQNSVTYEGGTNFNAEAAQKIEEKEKLLNPKENSKEQDGMFLKIPKIGVNWRVLYGGDPDKMLLQGFWQWPNTSDPSGGGNLIILGHRWVYRAPDPRTLYSLDKLKPGDPIFVVHKKKTYKYEMTESFVTEPTDSRQTEAFNDPMLTLVTSHPIETDKIISKQRLVVRAKMVPNN